MANSKYEYVRLFEHEDTLLPNTWIVVRIDGRGFHRLSAKYGFEKPNDRRALELMNAAAVGVLREVTELILAYGVSDEYSFVFHKSCTLFERRASKLVTTIVSTFTSYYVNLWPQYFPGQPLTPLMPSFDGRAVLYPSEQNLRDYLCWRQVDCHINNLYNTTFWALVQKGGMDPQAAEKELSGTLASDKNEILFSRFGINYNNEAEMNRKGTVLFRDYQVESSSEEAAVNIPSTVDEPSQSEMSRTAAEKERKKRQKVGVAVAHIDIIKDDFWNTRPWILSGRSGRLKKSIANGTSAAQIETSSTMAQ